MKQFFLVLLLAATCFGQSGILTSSRYPYDNWSHAGLPATITYGTGGSDCNGALTNCVETNPNVWTRAARVQSGSTINCTNSASDITNINNAIATAKPGSFVLLGGTVASPQTCNMNGTNVVLRTNGVTLRGSGPQATTLTSTSAFNIQFGVCCGAADVPLTSTSYASGTTSVTVSGGNSTPVVGQILYLSQCDTGWSGSITATGPSCTTGSYTDPGTIWVCGVDYPQCSNDTASSGNHIHQQQNVIVTSISGDCSASSCTIGFTPGLYMPNWSSTNNAEFNWQSTANTSYGVSIEDVTVKFPDNTNSKYDISAAYGFSIIGNRIIGASASTSIAFGGNLLQGLFMSNYSFGNSPAFFTNGLNEPFVRASNTATLTLNNIFIGGNGIWGDGEEVGEVIAYNYARDCNTLFYICKIINHIPSESFLLKEGNQFPQDQGDATHGTNNLDTSFRNFYVGWDIPYYTQNPWSVEMDNYNRMYNYIGNALGGARSTAYQGTSSSVGNVYVFPTSDTLATVGSMRWGNCDVINAGCRFLGSEVPTSSVLTSASFPNATAYQNSIPANNNLPCSFFMQGSPYTTSPCPIKSSGGTGLSWWKVCKTWTTFPTACATTQTQPFPAVGPDQSGGPYVSGFAYDIPASVAYTNLPIDTSLQSSYTITGTSWSNSAATCATQTSIGSAPCEILTVTMSSAINSSSVSHIMGGFQLSGVNAACIPSGLPANNEILMTGSTFINTTTIKAVYALASNPGVACTGTFKFPDIRQFDERVFILDPVNTPPPPPPPAFTMFSSIVVNGVVLH